MNVFSFSARHLRCIRHNRTPQWAVPVARPLTRGLQTESIGGTEEKAIEELAQSGALDMASIMAAPELQLSKIRYARPVPASPSYFSRTPQFNDEFVNVQTLLTRYLDLPTVPTSEAPRVAWKSLESYRAFTGEHVKASQFGKALQIAKRLNTINPALAPKEVRDALDIWARDIDPFGNKPKPIPIDRFGRAVGVGKRKEAVARAWVVEGTGEILINGKTLSEAFGRIHDRESAVWALYATNRMDKYNVWARVEGGGPTGQAEAMTLALAKALLAHEPDLKPALRRAGCVTRDPREVERKKAGHVKARKRPAWNKR
ncbi:related to MRPS9 - mitochondrial ribosomal protein, small subunit [Cephalotrichum gorgonifer]|uniref:Small ribosomal subunit protein uS9m n=1 Tax=Cephalotrichum gorgonifer TaxID=2041049 RepID=A0AAE8MPN7_9PEZI|nr:related to MRPS9 - mitochondrial ribosomal protein, small subunit [Cephalotrichum gorgonifer]